PRGWRQFPHSVLVPMNRLSRPPPRSPLCPVTRLFRSPRCIRRRTELPLPFDLLRRRRLLRQRVRLQFPDSRIVPVNRQRLVRLRNRVGQVARTIRRPRCIRRRTELPLPFDLPPRPPLPRPPSRPHRTAAPVRPAAPPPSAAPARPPSVS